jgi:polyisoprenoid-binding protein YceI
MSMSFEPAGFPVRAVVAALLSGPVLWGLSGCQTSPPPVAEPAPVPAAEPGVPAGARTWAVVAEDSLLQIQVYRGGAMARLGHNHVIASRHLAGEVFVTGDPVATRFDIRVPVNELTVDEPALRELAGPDFATSVPQSAREGTRRNLLSEALLDGSNYPEIRLRATDVKVGADNGFDVGVEITFKGQVRQVRIPVTLERAADTLTAKGEFRLRQSELGLQPFSVAMGTLVVLDEMRVSFTLVAKMGTVPIS